MSSTRQDPLVRLAHFVGDFGNPFYREERHRDVWNEASAFGLQLVLWFALVAGTLAVWVRGAPAVPYVCVAMGLVGLVCLLTLGYAQRLGVELTGRERMMRWRMLPYCLLVGALGVGLLRTQEATLELSSLAGMATGAGLVVLGTVVGLRRSRRA